MIANALILGGNHALGRNLGLDSTIDLQGYTVETFGLYQSFAGLIAQGLGFNPVNESVHDGSSDAMFRIMETYCNPYNHRVRPGLVIACWQTDVATEIIDPASQQWYALTLSKPHKFNCSDMDTYSKRWQQMHKRHDRGQLQTVKNILATNELARTNGIAVINIMVDTIDHKSLCTIPWGGDIGFCVWCQQHDYQLLAQGNYSSEAHKQYAKMIVNRARSKYNLQ